MDVHKGRKVQVGVMFTMPLLEKVDAIASGGDGEEAGSNKRSWAVRELVKEAIEAREKGAADGR